jgi:hypothetical protein
MWVADKGCPQDRNEVFMIALAILTGILSILNYAWWLSAELSPTLQIISIAAQAVLAVITIFAAVRYRGKRVRKSYDGAGYKIFTIPFAVIFLSILGSIAILVVLFLRMTGAITAL